MLLFHLGLHQGLSLDYKGLVKLEDQPDSTSVLHFLFHFQDMKERISENPLAYTGNTLHFELSQEEIEKSKKKNWNGFIACWMFFEAKNKWKFYYQMLKIDFYSHTCVQRPLSRLLFTGGLYSEVAFS